MCITELAAAQERVQQRREQCVMLDAARVYAKRASNLCPEIITAALKLDGEGAMKVLQTLALTLEALQELTQGKREGRYEHDND